MEAESTVSGIPSPTPTTGLAPRFADWAQTAILVIGAAFLGCLSIFVSLVTVLKDKTVSLAYVPSVLAGLAVWTVLVMLVASLGKVPDERRTARIGFVIGLIMSIVWVLVSNSGPTYDSINLSAAALAFWGDAPMPTCFDEEWLQSGGNSWGMGWTDTPNYASYMGRFPFQIPFMLILLVCQKVAGENFGLMYQLINAFANGVTFYLICRIAYELSSDDRASLVALGISVAFAPLTLFATFIYGNTLSFPWALGAWLLCLRMSNSSPTWKRLATLVAAGVCIGISTLVKSTMNISAIAFAIVVLLYAVRDKQWALMPTAIVPFAVTSMVMGLLIPPIERHTGTELEQAPPKTAWIVMGIGGGQELSAEERGSEISPDDLRVPGYFDAYVWKTPAKEPEYATWDELNAHALSLRLKRFSDDPSYMARFFARKLAIEWCEPTMEGFVVSNYEGRAEGEFLTKLADDHREYTPYGRSFYYGKAYAAIFAISDAMQSAIALGALAWVLRRLRNTGHPGMMALMSLLFVCGGALLYVFWENKSQYILPFYVFLMPYAACGWAILASAVRNGLRPRHATPATDEPATDERTQVEEHA